MQRSKAKQNERKQNKTTSMDDPPLSLVNEQSNLRKERTRSTNDSAPLFSHNPNCFRFFCQFFFFGFFSTSKFIRIVADPVAHFHNCVSPAISRLHEKRPARPHTSTQRHTTLPTPTTAITTTIKTNPTTTGLRFGRSRSESLKGEKKLVKSNAERFS